MTDGYLNKTYRLRSPKDVRKHYDAWAASYEAEVAENGYATPKRCASALARFVKDKSKPLLDFGCGTGLSGLALKLAGFEIIDGIDLSADMLKCAADKKLYRNLTQTDAGSDNVGVAGNYSTIAAIGVIGAGAAPISVFDTLMQALQPDGLLVLSLNDHSLADPASEAKINEWLDCGAARLLLREYGPHLPGINLKSNVYIIEKT